MDELKPTEQRNEPSTAEIVKALRCSADDDSFCKKCQYGYALGSAFLCDKGRMNGNAADRLESQERTIADLTARAESAERERDAAVKDMWLMRSCQSCKHKPEEYPHIRCACPDCDDEDKWEWRGLQPQDGGAE